MNKQHILRNGKEIFKVDCIIADQTHSIKLVLWEELINQVDCGKSYLFRGLTTRVFDYVKYLSTSEATIIETKDKITNINLTSDEIKDTIIEGQCIGVHIKKKNSRHVSPAITHWIQGQIQNSLLVHTAAQPCCLPHAPPK